MERHSNRTLGEVIDDLNRDWTELDDIIRHETASLAVMVDAWGGDCPGATILRGELIRLMDARDKVDVALIATRGVVV